VPEFVADVERFRQGSRKMSSSIVSFTDTLGGDPADAADSLYMALWYAYDRGVTVVMEPKERL
jgi:hypothetical protein